MEWVLLLTCGSPWRGSLTRDVGGGVSLGCGNAGGNGHGTTGLGCARGCSEDAQVSFGEVTPRVGCDGYAHWCRLTVGLQWQVQQLMTRRGGVGWLRDASAKVKECGGAL